MYFYQFMQRGGPFIYPLLVLSILTLAVFMERFCFLVFRLKHIDRIAAFKKNPEDLFLEEVYTENIRGFSLLSFIAGAAPLFGLLGTVSGIMVIFRKIEALSYQTDPSMLASGIWQAIITTLAGLIITIPATGALYYLDFLNRKIMLSLRRKLQDQSI